MLHVLNWTRNGSFTQSLSAADLGYGLCNFASRRTKVTFVALCKWTGVLFTSYPVCISIDVKLRCVTLISLKTVSAARSFLSLDYSTILLFSDTVKVILLKMARRNNNLCSTKYIYFIHFTHISSYTLHTYYWSRVTVHIKDKHKSQWSFCHCFAVLGSSMFWGKKTW